MAKTANINVKLEVGLKKEVDAIFKSLGISTAEAVRLFFRKVKDFKRLPFEDDVPNEETLQVMRDTDEGKNLTEWESLDSYFNYIEENVKAENHS
ncbi:MAG: type II toxin-antitoxin system RelB/DinJ family antitoxin [Candidatus Aminicenantes bacterium]|nr:type II toxin-antitoxin system RelB/DinJ family antitoxin [Candidatus Aminicenantes bacterium]